MNLTPSRLLNEQAGFFGLSIIDIGVIGYSLILTHSILKVWALEFLAFIIAGALGFSLIGVRLKYRPKVIRDYSTFMVSKRIRFRRGGVL